MRQAMVAATVVLAIAAATPAWAGDSVMVVQSIRDGAAILPPPPGLSLAGARRLDTLPPVFVGIVADEPSTAALRRGFGAAMTSFYPFSATGFHLSGGSRYSARALAGRTGDPVYAPLLWAPRGSASRSTRRFSPAMLVGYDRPVAEGMTLGVDGGVVMGRIDNARLGPHGGGRGNGFDHASGSNPVARMTVGYVF